MTQERPARHEHSSLPQAIFFFFFALPGDISRQVGGAI
jgi:hypothetical protein